MGATFAASTCVVASLRGKSDRLNHLIGGASTGLVAGAWLRSSSAGIYTAIFMAAAAYLKKMSAEEGWTFLPEVKQSHREMQFVDVNRHDWSTLKGK